MTKSLYPIVKGRNLYKKSLCYSLPLSSYLVGQVMKQTKGKPNPPMVNKLFVEAIEQW
ncbi:hypothetical protein [Brevibacillus sp. WF146]|uniref:hypothetical protein n=1 Tax=Brevibacillus sp. WF146 TaxID=319501 RepID=UPI0029CAC29A|nr:hypothetical protein [Brevibacillus sp. WF146]